MIHAVVERSVGLHGWIAWCMACRCGGLDCIIVLVVLPLYCPDQNDYTYKDIQAAV